MTDDPSEIVRRGYDLVSTAYCPDDGGENRQHYKAWLAELEPHLTAGARIIDLGCGCGIPVSRELSRKHKVCGIDLSEVQIERARRLVPRATFRCKDVTKVHFPTESFDAAVLLYALIHIPLPQQRDFLGRVSGWLRPRGLLLVSGGSEAWTGTEESWLGVEGATMYWSHADTETYRDWLRQCGLDVRREWYQPEGESSHPGGSAILAYFVLWLAMPPPDTPPQDGFNLEDYREQ